MSTTLTIIFSGAVLTYAARIGGHVVLSRFRSIHPRVEAGLDAVPAAVLTTLVAPAAINGGPAEFAALCVAALVGFRYSLMPMFLAGAVTIILLRNIF